jgi:hypothetical protein
MVYRSARPGRTAVLMLAGEEGWERTAAGVLGSLSLPWGGAGDIMVPVTADGPHPAFRPAVRAFDPDWISAYRHTSEDVPRPDDEGAMWLIDVPEQHVATVAGWCSPFPGRHGFFLLAARGEAVHSPLVPLLAFTSAWEPRLLTAGPDDVPALAELALTGAAGSVLGKIGYMREQPLERSMLGMSRMAPARARRRPWVVVVGGTCADFCFALACDRLLGGGHGYRCPGCPARSSTRGSPR